jgi:hypothetical protein
VPRLPTQAAQVPPGPARPDTGTAARDDRRWAVAVGVAYLVIIAAATFHHELWRDEWQAWLIARDSTTLADLLFNIRHEGHPPGWYLPLFALAQLTRNPLAMQLLHVALAAGGAYLLARFAPIPRYQKLLILGSYFIAYEYAVVARAYALGVVGLFLFCAAARERERHIAMLACGLLLLAGSTVYGLLLAGAAGGAVAVDLVMVRRQEHRVLGPRSRRVAAAMAGVAIALLVLLYPAAERYLATRWNPEGALSRWAIAATTTDVGAAYLPFPNLAAGQIWSSHFLVLDSRASLAIALAISAAIFVTGILMFARKPAVLFFYTAGSLSLLAFNHFVFAGSLRHIGQLFLVFVASLWLARLPLYKWRLPKPLKRWTGVHTRGAHVLIGVVFTVQLASTAVLYAADLRRPFSNATMAADVLRRPELIDLPLAASAAPAASPIAGLLDRPIHYLDIGRPSTFVPWGEYRGHVGWERIFARLEALVADAGGEAVLITVNGLGAAPTELEFEKIAEIPAGLVISERYILYRVRDRNAGS